MGDTCRTCGAPIVWVRMSSGKTMPLDAAPVLHGTFRVRDGAAEFVSDDDRQAALLAGSLYVSHFATCPQAADHRRT